MIDCLSIVEIDKVLHIMETGIVKLVVEIESFVMSSDKFDKETGSSDGLQPNESASASATTGVGSTSAPTIREIISTNRNPQIWKDFNLCIMTDNSQKAQCKHCFHFLSVGSNTTLRNHIEHPHCEAKKAQKNQNSEAGQTSMARDESVFMYDPDYIREQFAGLVIQRALPFNHFDHEQTTKVFQNTMQPRYAHVSRSTLKRDAMKLWLAVKQEIIDSFGNINACVNLTTDVWSAPYGVPSFYMCVTAHWIEPGTWQMMKRVISFEEFSSPHTGGALFKMLTKVLTNFNLEDKVMSITLDNASNNTSAMDKLKLKYEPPMGVWRTSSRLRPYHFTYPERELTMEEILHKFIDEGKREHEEMRAFINDFKTTNEILLKERDNSLIELRFEVQKLLRIIESPPTSICEIKGVTTRGEKTTTQDLKKDDTNMNGEEPPEEARDKPIESYEVLMENQPQRTNAPIVQQSIRDQTPSIPFPKRLRKENEEA
ncbi:zinc finger BED domain-containing protein DAYSLEEPER [Tanacetum coccineum]